MYNKLELETIYNEYYIHCSDITNEMYNDEMVKEVLAELTLFAFYIMKEPDAKKTQDMADKIKDFMVMYHNQTWDQLQNKPDIKSYPCPCLRKQIKETYDKINEEIEQYDENDESIKLKELLKKLDKYEAMMEQCTNF